MEDCVNPSAVLKNYLTPTLFVSPLSLSPFFLTHVCPNFLLFIPHAFYTFSPLFCLSVCLSVSISRAKHSFSFIHVCPSFCSLSSSSFNIFSPFFFLSLPLSLFCCDKLLACCKFHVHCNFVLDRLSSKLERGSKKWGGSVREKEKSGVPSHSTADLSPNCKVLLVSASLYEDGEQQMTRVVRALPPKLSCNTRVSLLSLYGR